MRFRSKRTVLIVCVVLMSLAISGFASAAPPKPRLAYTVHSLGSPGASSSGGQSINNRGWVAGYSNTSDDSTVHATLWRGKTPDDLGTLGGPNSAVLWPVKSNRNLIVGISETAEIDPYDENWSCSFFFPSETDHACVGFVWENGEMTPLPTLGGTHGFATGANSRNQVVGWAETTVEDDTCVAPQRFQFLAVVWEKRGSEWTAHELPPLPGDTVSAATAINDRGQIVGISGICDIAVGRFSARNAVIWDTDGSVTSIGSLGGIAWNTPMAINNGGQIVGFSNVSADDGGNFVEGAFYWSKREGIRPLGLLDGNVDSQALGINNRGQIVGQSCGAEGCTAVIWENHDADPLDLNNLIHGRYDGHLDYANDINDRGEITGGATLTRSDESVAFRASPKRGHWHD